MKKLLILIFALSLAGAAAAECRVYSTAGAPDSVTLDNGLLKISFAPELNGSLIKWEYQPQKRSIIRPLNYRVEKIDLLPPRVFASQDGFRCRVWETNRKITDAMQVKSLTASQSDGCRLTLHAPLTGGAEIDVTENLHLLPGSTVLNGEIILINNQGFSDNYSIWFNAVFALSDNIDPVMVPARSKVQRIGKLGMVEVGADGILSELHEGNRNMYFAAFRPWIAKAAVGKPGVAVLKIDEKNTERMILYTHKSAKLHTMEILAPSKKLDAAKSLHQKFQIFFFPSLSAVREICGSYGVDFRNGNLEIESAVPVRKSEWQINGKKFIIPALKPGELHKIPFPGVIGKGLKIVIGNQEFTLPGILDCEMKAAE